MKRKQRKVNAVQKRGVKKQVVKPVVRSSQTKVNILPKMVIVISLLLLLLVIAGVYRFYVVGKAGEGLYDTPPLDKIIDLNTIGLVQFNINNFQTWKVWVYSSDKKSYTMLFNLSSLPSGAVAYEIYLPPGGDRVARGLLSSEVPSFDLYLPDDDKVDLEISYDAGYIQIVNPYYVEPEMSNVTVFKETDTGLAQQNGKLFYLKLGEPVVFLFNASSTKTPVVTAQWENGTNLTVSEFLLNFSNATSRVMRLDFTPVEEKPYVLIVNATVDTKVTTKKYVFAVGNIVYVLQEAKVPDMMMKKVNDGFNLTVTFEPGTVVQPFSLPCGTVDLEQWTGGENVSVIKTFAKTVQEWKKGVPSEFSFLELGVGYRLDVAQGKVLESLMVHCTSNNNFLPEPELPTLLLGWNLIGVPGYETVLLKNMQKKAPFGSSITKVYVLTSDGAVVSSEGELEPGKAYWVKVE